jgi:hypothetical protein
MKFRKKPVEIKAEQYEPGTDIDGVIIKSDEIVFSSDRKYYYIARPKSMARHWLSVEKFPGTVPEDKKNGGLWDKVMVQITLKTGEVYYREEMDFAMWSVKGRTFTEPADLDSDLYLDYIASMGWPREREIYAYIETLEGRHEVTPGDWIITGVKGEKYPCKPDIFEETYEPV